MEKPEGIENGITREQLRELYNNILSELLSLKTFQDNCVEQLEKFIKIDDAGVTKEELAYLINLMAKSEAAGKDFENVLNLARELRMKIQMMDSGLAG